MSRRRLESVVMAPWRILRLPYPVPEVFDAAVAAASESGLGIIHLDRGGGHLSLHHPSRFGGRGWHLDLAVIDSGLGLAVLRMSWQPARPLSRLAAGRGRCAGRFCGRIRRILATAADV